MARLVNSNDRRVKPDQWNQFEQREPDFDWSHYLNRNETIEWRGRPSGGIKLSTQDIATSVFASIFICSGLYVIFSVLNGNMKGGASIGLLIGIAHFSVGFYMAIARHFVSAYKRKKTYYALTKSRALISENGTLHSIALRDGSNFEIQHHKDSESIYFDQFRSGGRFSNIRFNTRRSDPKKLGFQWISNGRDAYQKLLQIVEDLK